MSDTASPTPLELLGLHPPDASYHAEAVLTFRRRVRAWVAAHRRSLLVVTVLVAAVGILHAWGISHGPAVTDDEGTYMSQAWAVVHQHALAPYTYWYDHPPLGWLQLVGWAAATGAFRPGIHAIVAGREMMVLAAMLSAALLYLLARRLRMRRSSATMAVLLFGFSPLALHYQRLVLLDNIAVPWLLAALVLAASPRRSLWAACASGACLSASVLSKETFLLFAPAVVVLLWTRAHPHTRSFCLTGFAATFLLLLAGYPLYAALKGELLPGSGHVSLWQAVTYQLSGRQSSGSVFTSTSNAHHTVSAWMNLDYWELGLGLAAVGTSLTTRRLWAVAAGLLVPVVVALRGGYLPDPFAIGLIPFAALSVAGALDLAAGPVRQLTEPATKPVDSISGVGNQRSRRRPAAAFAVGAALLGLLATQWVPGDETLVQKDVTAPVFATEAWIEAHIGHDQRLIVDDSLWTDLVEHGFNPHLGVVWFYKLDTTANLDPSVERALPQGWRDFAYVVSSPIMRSALRATPSGFKPVRQALAYSSVVATFGTGGGRLEVRRINAPAAGATVASPGADTPANQPPRQRSNR